MNMRFLKIIMTLFSFLFLLTGTASLALSKSDELIKTYTPVISKYFREKGITYSNPVRSRDPFLVQEKCDEIYHEYSIKSIHFLKTEKSTHLFRVYCSGFDSCKKVLVTDEYRVRINISNSRITHTKLENGEK